MNRHLVKLIRRAWTDAMPTTPPITYTTGPIIDLDLLAQIAVNVLTPGGTGDTVRNQSSRICPGCSAEPFEAHDQHCPRTRA